jgi:PAS domain S-box-containing protein
LVASIEPSDPPLKVSSRAMINGLFDASNLTPHGVGLDSNQWLIWVNAGANAATALAWFSLALSVIWFISRRNDLPHRRKALLFTAFIVACGWSHGMAIVTLWVPAYHAEAAANVLTACLSIVTVAALWPLVPKLLALQSPGRLQALNRELRKAQATLLAHNAGQDQRVRERTEELVRLNDTISRNELRFRQVVEGAPSAIVMVDANGSIEMVNVQAERMFGYARSELLGRPIEILIPARFHARHPGLRTAFRTDARARAMGAQTLLFGVHKSGREFEVEIGLNPIDTDEGLKVLSAIVDISERLRAAAELKLHAEQASRAKSRFLASVSHELRTPLNGILGYAQLLQMEGPLDKTQKSRVDAMLGAGQHLLSTINSVLDLSEIEAGRLQLHATKYDLAAVLTKCVSFVQPTAAEKGLVLRVTLDPGLPQWVLGDRTRLQQVLVNLLGNAVKFTAQGVVELYAGAADGIIEFAVSDTGPGIPINHLERIFREFERLDAHVAGAVEGSGLGLALCVRLVGLMGGNLRYQDNPGGGSVFDFDVPLPACESPEISVRTPAAGSAAAEQPNRRVLVVDDIAMNRDVASSFLRTAGHHVTVAENGTEAVEAVSIQDFDVVLMDIRMPVVDGLEATRRIRKIAGNRGAVPIIGLTAQAFVQQIEECWLAGMDGHLSKPFTLESLLDTVRQAPYLASQRRPPVPADAAKASPVATTADPPLAPRTAPEFMVLHRTTFERTAAHLEPGVVLSYLQTLSEHAENLLSRLLAPEILVRSTNTIAEAAHALAGSAGMFGFDRLCATALAFEHAMDSDTAQTSMLTGDLVAVLRDSLHEMQKMLLERAALAAV